MGNRKAVVIASSVATQPTQTTFRAGLVRKTAEQIARVLEHLPHGYSFDVDAVVEESAGKAKSRILKGSESCAKSGALLLIYYFGHARVQGDDLAFAHPSRRRGEPDYLPFSDVLAAIRYGKAKKVLVILDCCYAGAGAFTLLRGDFDYCMMACTDDSTRAWYNDNIERPPIGFFTESILNGFSNPEATVSVTDDSITAASLFKYAKAATKEVTIGRQEPLLAGKLDEDLSKFSPIPVIIPGVTNDAPPKSGYCKLLAILSAIGTKQVDTIEDLRRRVLHKYQETFLTPYKDKDGRITERPVQLGVLRRYVAFLRAMGAIDDDTLMLTVSGMGLTADHRSHYNEGLLRLLDLYLSRFGLTRDLLRATMQKILRRRSLTTKANVLTALARTSRHPLEQGKLGMLMDLLGHIGAIGMPGRREQVYFPWSEPMSRTRGR